VATGEADEAADLFGERLTGERGFGVFFGGHGGGGWGRGGGQSDTVRDSRLDIIRWKE
jgi:hypothetical protein